MPHSQWTKAFCAVWVLCVLQAVSYAQTPQGATSEQKTTRTGDIRTHEFASQFVPTRTVLVYLPPGYSNPKNAHRRYSVFYLHDGQNVFDGATSFIPGKEWRADETAEALITASEMEPIILVAVYNAGPKRTDEYTPVVDPKYNVGGGAEAYGKMLARELKPFVDKTYRTQTGRGSCGTGGASLGGLVSLYLGLTYPDVFGKVAVMSPSVWWANRDILARVQAVKQKPNLKIWLDMGGQEGKEADKELANARELRRALMAKGWTDTHLRYYEDGNAQHDETAWAGRFGNVLRFLYPVGQ
jgi:predicted alpha/beta superfamily hydrolase